MIKKGLLILVLIIFYSQTYAIQFFVGDEQGGNNLTSRTALDTQSADRMSSFSSSPEFLDLHLGTASSSISFPSVATFSLSGVTIGLSLRDMSDMGMNSIGVLAASPATAQAGQTLQDGAPKPQSRYTTSSPHTVYRNDLAGSNASRNALLIEFSGIVAGFGGWFGDVETRSDGSGTQAELRLLDDNYNLIDQLLIPTSTSDQSLCGSPINDTYLGCGNGTARWIGFRNEDLAPVKYAVMIVGDDDSSVGSNDAYGEHLSFMGGIVAACTPIPEVCDGLDNDCDGTIDNGLDQVISCSQGTGMCFATGTITISCSAGSYVTGSCTAPALPSSFEICDGLDNDCDGTIDNGLDQVISCSQGTGMCNMTGAITISCVSGVYSTGVCTAIAGSSSFEICDGLDNDCDGQTDEGLSVDYACSQGTGGCFMNGNYTVSCNSGSISTGSCSAVAKNPVLERCDFIDNDCNGVVDDGLICMGGTTFTPQPIPDYIAPQDNKVYTIDAIASNTVTEPIKRILDMFTMVDLEVQHEITSTSGDDITITPDILPQTGAK